MVSLNIKPKSNVFTMKIKVLILKSYLLTLSHHPVHSKKAMGNIRTLLHFHWATLGNQQAT